MRGQVGAPRPRPSVLAEPHQCLKPMRCWKGEGLLVNLHAVSRTICLLMLTASRFGVWILEQPGSSVLDFYPAWLHMMDRHYECFGPCGVLSSETCSKGFSWILVLLRCGRLDGGCSCTVRHRRSGTGHGRIHLQSPGLTSAGGASNHPSKRLPNTRTNRAKLATKGRLS